MPTMIPPPEDTNRFAGVELPPHWKIVPPGYDPKNHSSTTGPSLIVIAPGPGFGTGTHETTQLCLLALGYLRRTGFAPRTVLDFGSGSGILSIAAAQSGAHVEAVEIETAANQHARHNARHNGVETLIDIRTVLSEPNRPYDLIVANILRPVLITYAEALCLRQNRQGFMVLSGLLSTDVPAIIARYTPLLESMKAEIYERGDWRAVMFSPIAEAR